MRRLTLALIAAAPLGVLLAQSPPQQLTLPHLPEARLEGATQAANAAANDPVSLYKDRREAAIAALQAGYKAATIERNPTRAMALLLVSLRRDPAFAKALFTIGILCARSDRWQDALRFYEEARRVEPDAGFTALVNAEIERVQAIAQAESSADGRRRREYDTRLVAVLRGKSDPVVVLEEANRLSKLDASRWEAAALAGFLRADLGAYAESGTALAEAARLAPPARRAQLESAAEIARHEAAFLELVRGADERWEKKDYAGAGPMYAEAWENSPGRLAVAMQSVTAYLLADQIPPAVQALSRMRERAPAETNPKLEGMLKALGAVSPEAVAAAQLPVTPTAGPSSANPGERIRELVGQLTTPAMLQLAQDAPALPEDTTRLTPIPDEELTAGRSDLALLSTDSVFALYQKNAALNAQPPEGEAALRAEPSPETSTALQPVRVGSVPAGATIVFDADATNRCVTPCQVTLTPGRHALHAILTGYQDALKIFVVEKDGASQRVEVTMERSTPGRRR